MIGHIWNVFWYELGRNFRRRGFLFATFGIPMIAMIGYMIVVRLIVRWRPQSGPAGARVAWPQRGAAAFARAEPERKRTGAAARDAGAGGGDAGGTGRRTRTTGKIRVFPVSLST